MEEVFGERGEEWSVKEDWSGEEFKYPTPPESLGVKPEEYFKEEIHKMYREGYDHTYPMPLSDRFVSMLETAEAAFIRLKDDSGETSIHAKNFARIFGYSDGPEYIPDDVLTANCCVPEGLSRNERKCIIVAASWTGVLVKGMGYWPARDRFEVITHLFDPEFRRDAWLNVLENILPMEPFKIGGKKRCSLARTIVNKPYARPSLLTLPLGLLSKRSISALNFDDIANSPLPPRAKTNLFLWWYELYGYYQKLRTNQAFAEREAQRRHPPRYGVMQ